MRKIRVFIIDDAAAMRRLIAEALAADAELEIAGSAENGRVALDRIPHARPDVLVLDLEMPVMGGLEMLAELRRLHPGLPVIVFSSDTRPGAEATLDALWLGAGDYVTKSHAHSPAQAVRHIHAELVPRIKALCASRLPAAAAATRPGPKGARAAARTAPMPSRPRTPRAGPIQVLAIGASTGGPNALGTLLPALSHDLPVPIVIVQHMPPLFTRFLAERLSAKGVLPVREAADGDELAPGQAWIAPGDFHMRLELAGASVRVKLDRGAHVNSCRPSVDTLFESVAEVFGGAALGVVLTGMGQDGLKGCERLVAAGSRVLAQDEASSVVWGMPGMVARAGYADRILPLDRIAAEILQRVSRDRTPRRKAA
ncbi:MAG: protein-glutamate methylesterase/protein-glutamine glutaminase [Candidatus Eiseniibacteriota bacterium]